jgi:hypothetical protein
MYTLVLDLQFCGKKHKISMSSTLAETFEAGTAIAGMSSENIVLCMFNRCFYLHRIDG